MCEKLRATRPFKFELAEQRFDTAHELRVVCDGICKVRAPDILSLVRAERGHEKVPQVVHRARAHAQIKLEIGNKSSDIVAGRLAEARATRELEQRVCVFFVPIGGERFRLRFGWRRELNADSVRRSYLRDWLSACDVLRFGLRGVTACELRFDLNRLSANTKRRSGLRKFSANTKRRPDLRGMSACELRSDVRCRLHGSSLKLKRRGSVQRRCGARLQRSRHSHSTRDARCAL